MEGQSQSVQHDPTENILDDFREWLHFQETRWRNGRTLSHWSPGIAPGEPLLDPKLRQTRSKPRPIAMRISARPPLAWPWPQLRALPSLGI